MYNYNSPFNFEVNTSAIFKTELQYFPTKLSYLKLTGSMLDECYKLILWNGEEDKQHFHLNCIRNQFPCIVLAICNHAGEIAERQANFGCPFKQVPEDKTFISYKDGGYLVEFSLNGRRANFFKNKRRISNSKKFSLQIRIFTSRSGRPIQLFCRLNTLSYRKDPSFLAIENPKFKVKLNDKDFNYPDLEIGLENRGAWIRHREAGKEVLIVANKELKFMQAPLILRLPWYDDQFTKDLIVRFSNQDQLVVSNHQNPSLCLTDPYSIDIAEAEAKTLEIIGEIPKEHKNRYLSRKKKNLTISSPKDKFDEVIILPLHDSKFYVVCTYDYPVLLPPGTDYTLKGIGVFTLEDVSTDKSPPNSFSPTNSSSPITTSSSSITQNASLTSPPLSPNPLPNTLPNPSSISQNASLSLPPFSPNSLSDTLPDIDESSIPQNASLRLSPFSPNPLPNTDCEDTSFFGQFSDQVSDQYSW